MKGIIKINRLNKKSRCVVSEKDFDEKVGGDFWLVLEPFTDCEEQPFFYYKKIDDGYLVEGEAYICTSIESVNYHKNRTNAEYKSVEYRENNDLQF